MSTFRLITKRSPLAYTLAGQQSQRYNSPQVLGYKTATFQDSQGHVKERRLTEADRLQGLFEERQNETSILGKTINKMYDMFWYKTYRGKPNWVWPRMFYSNPWMRYMSIDGIPGSGHDNFGKELAKFREVNWKDSPDLYYFFKRHGQQCQAELALSDSFKNGGLGNYYEERYNMDWSKVINNPDDWKMACRCMAWQLRTYRLADMDNATDNLLGMMGTMQNRSWMSYRAEIHAFGETNLIPDVMYQSFIDQYTHMRSKKFPLHVCLYMDVSPEEAFNNIQKDPNRSEAEKKFYTLDFLKAYQEGYEEFVIPSFEAQHTLVVRIKPEEVEDIEYFCEDLLDKHKELYDPASDWNVHSMLENWIFAKPHVKHNKKNAYWSFVEDNLDIKDQQRRVIFARNYMADMPWRRDIETGIRCNHGEKLIDWTYPINCVDDGAEHDHFGNSIFHDGQSLIYAKHWHGYQGMTDIQRIALNKRGYGYARGMNKGEESCGDLASILCHDNVERWNYKPLSKWLLKPWVKLGQ